MTISVSAAYVQTEVNFFEIGMKRDGDPQDSGLAEAKSYQAYECTAVPQVQFGPGGNISFEQDGIRVIVQHGKIPPLRCEKFFASPRIHHVLIYGPSR